MFNKWWKKNWSSIIKNKKVKKSKKFLKNLINHFYYLNTNFAGQLEKMIAVRCYPHMRPFLSYLRVLYIFW